MVLQVAAGNFKFSSLTWKAALNNSILKYGIENKCSFGHYYNLSPAEFLWDSRYRRMHLSAEPHTHNVIRTNVIMIDPFTNDAYVDVDWICTDPALDTVKDRLMVWPHGHAFILPRTEWIRRPGDDERTPYVRGFDVYCELDINENKGE